MNCSLFSRKRRLVATAETWLWTGVLMFAAVHGSVCCAIADDIPSALRAHLDEDNSEEEDDENVTDEPDRFRRTAQRESAPTTRMTRTPHSNSDGPGMIGQVGHLAFKTFGRNQSISPIEAMPYVLTDEHFFFGDLRGFVSNNALFGGNVGLGYRYLREDHNAWYGASVWYDADGTTGQTYQQIGLSFEALVDRFELRSNVYLPVTSSQTYSNTIGNERIVGNQLLYARFVDQGSALQGVDFEGGYSLPIKELHRLRGFVGYYHFDGGPSGGVNGFKTRVEGVINNSVTAQVLYTNDKLFGSNVMVGCEVQFPWGGSHPTSKWRQNTPSPFRFVERNYNVIVDRGVTVNDGLIAFNPLTHAAYNIQQVSSSAPGGTPASPIAANGSATSPWQTVAQAQQAGADVILVQGNSILTTGVTLADGQQLLGDGTLQSLALDGGGSVVVPTQVSGGAMPQFSGVNGAAVQLGSHSTFAGFKIIGNNGNAVVGSGVSDVTLRDLTFQNITGDAIRMTNSTGSVKMQNINIDTTSGNGVNFIGGAPNLTFSGSIKGTQGDGILLSNLTGGTVSIWDTTIQSTGGSGLRLSNVAADVTADGLSISQTSGPAINISGGTSANTYHFTGTTKIEQPNGTGLNVNSAGAVVTVDNLVVDSTAGSPAISLTNSTGKITLSKLDVDTTNAVGLYGRSLTSLVVSGGSIKTVNAGAVDVQNSTISATLGQVSANGGPFGIRLITNTGSFSVVGDGTNYGSGGTIQNTTNGVIATSAGNLTLNWMDLTTNGTAIQTSGNNQVSLGALRISGSTGYALDSLNDTVLMLTGSSMTNNGALGGGTIRAQVSTVASYQWLISGNSIVDHNGTPILLQTQAAGNGASLATTVGSNTITSDRAGVTMVNINWNGPLSAAVATNTFNANADNITGVVLNDQSTTDSVIARINNNLMTFTGSQGTGIVSNAAAGSTLQVDTNSITFKGIGGTGLRFNLGGVNSSWIYSNIITDSAGGGTGMLFDAVAANSRMQIEANTINLLSTDLTVHRGIIFTTVTPTIQFTSNYNNVINNASTIFSIPVNSSTGRLLINGAQYP